MMSNLLDAIALEAAKTDQAASGAGESQQGRPGPEAAPAPPPKPATETQLNALLEMLIKQASQKFPSVADVWDDEKRALFCGALGPLLDKYHLDAFGFFELWKVEIMATVICVPLLYLTAMAIRADLERDAAGKAKDVSPGVDGEGEPFKPSAGFNADGIAKS